MISNETTKRMAGMIVDEKKIHLIFDSIYETKISLTLIANETKNLGVAQISI